jgi:hypothetical protein
MEKNGPTKSSHDLKTLKIFYSLFILTHNIYENKCMAILHFLLLPALKYSKYNLGHIINMVNSILERHPAVKFECELVVSDW